MARLEQLQRRKEALVQKVINSLTSRLNQDDATRAGKAARGVDKVNNHLHGHVKRRVTAVTPPPPHQHHGVSKPLGAFLGFTTSMLSTASAAQWMGQGYTYSNVAANYSSGQLYGYGATAENYSSYGHRYQLSTTLSLRGENRGVSWQAPGYGYPYIQSPTLLLPIVNPITRIPFDGIADQFTSGTIMCPYSYVVYSMATALSSIQVMQTIAVGEVRFTAPNPVVIRPGGTAILNVPLQASPNLPLGTAVTLDLTIVDQTSAVEVDFVQTQPALTTFTMGAKQAVNVTFDVKADQNQPAGTTQSASFKVLANLSISNSTAKPLDSPRRSQNTCTIQIP